MVEPSTSQKPSTSNPLPDGLVAFIKRDCPTCELVIPVLNRLAESATLSVYSQDDPDFGPPGLVRYDADLAVSWHNDIETVPTLIKVVDGSETDRIVGWLRDQWEEFTGIAELGPDLPAFRPGCGSLSVDPDRADELAARFGGSALMSRRVEFASREDEFEAAFDRGWTDGLPVVPPTEKRVLAMLEGTDRSPTDVVATVPPDLVEATVEQVAINAVMAGCKPEYFPVVLAAVEAACTEEFNIHGLLATTYFSGPIIVVNGPIAQQIGMNANGNVFGQGNRANLTIGRALQLVILNLGGGRPGGVDMAAMGSPGKLSFCFAEREHDSPFAPLATDRGMPDGTSALTLFAGHGPTAIVDQQSRTAESLARSLAACLRAVAHPKLAVAFDAMLVVSPEHGRLFAEAKWDRSRLSEELAQLLTLETNSMLQGVDGIAEGLPLTMADSEVPKFGPGGLQIVHAGGDAGLFSAILGGWVGGPKGSQPVTVAIGEQ